MTFALLHARHLRDFVRYHAEHPLELARVWDTVTEAELTPWYRSTVREDLARLAELEAHRRGVAPPPPPDRMSAVRDAMPIAAARDPDMFRARLETRSCYATSEEVAARPGPAERVFELAAEPVRMPPGPNRAQLLELIAASRARPPRSLRAARGRPRSAAPRAPRRR